MKTIIALCAAALIAAGAVWYRYTRLPDKFGTFEGAPAVKVAQLVANPKDYLHKTVSADGVVRKQCEAMGCYFSFVDGERSLRVELDQIAMNAPRREGHRVRVEGEVVPYGDGYELLANAVEFR